MQPVNKERQRKIRHELLTTIPKEGTAERVIWDTNRTASPLLRLPPELRNRIYDLVLNVGQINVCYRKWEHKSRPLRGGGTSASTSSPSQSSQSQSQQRITETTTATTTATVEGGGFYCRVLDKKQDPWKAAATYHRHHLSQSQLPSQQSNPSNNNNNNNKQQKNKNGMTLLSSISRQLYHETVLLPYALNVWSFESNHVMERLLLKEKRLPLPHRRAIRILYSPSVLTVAVEKALGQLEAVLLQGGVRMTKVVVVGQDGKDSKVVWEIAHRWWR